MQWESRFWVSLGNRFIFNAKIRKLRREFLFLRFLSAFGCCNHCSWCLDCMPLLAPFQIVQFPLLFVTFPFLPTLFYFSFSTAFHFTITNSCHNSHLIHFVIFVIYFVVYRILFLTPSTFLFLSIQVFWATHFVCFVMWK